MNRSLVVMLVVAVAGWMSSVSAQVFYEPVQYQFGSGAGQFYYGGHDPRVIEDARATLHSREYLSVVNGRHVVERSHVYTDSFRYSDVADNSYSSYASLNANDARNEANRNVPRYFRKSDLLKAAVLTDDGSWVVPAQAQPFVEIKVVKPFGATMGPVVPKGTILIIPRRWLEKPVKNGEPSVVMAQR